MEPNLRFGISERQGSIEKSRQLLFTTEDASKHYLDNRRIKDAWNRSLSTVHPDSSKLIPTLFRPAAFLPVTAPVVIMSMMPAKGMNSMVLPQVCLYGYNTAFTITNGNASYRLGSIEKALLGVGVFASSVFFGLIPHMVQMKYPLENFWLKKALPVVFLAQVSGMNVFACRSFERVRGIEVMDKEGRVIGYSRKAGRKAVRDTAISRAVLFGTSALVPEVTIYFLKRTQFFPLTPLSLKMARVSFTLLIMGLMVPASFGMFPQVGQIQCSKLEEEIQSSTEETELFYNRGV
ncbi:sideroflexin-4 isoform X2 [Nannospalax galili]|uniref:sideroflexin-4 isoform X2 n=1 Tax=Nannospalax galili TaxID=1026970 RepID=UPI0004ED0392|nr:sideroflexin-4 isoform X2 [Nannospalax galili]